MRTRIKNSIIAGVLIFIGCWGSYGLIRRYQESNIYEIEFHGTNPTEYVFPFPIDSIKRIIDNMEYTNFKSFVELKYKSVPDSNYYYYRPISSSCGSYVFRHNGINKNEPVRQHYEQSVELYPMSENSTKVIVNNVVQMRKKGVKFWCSFKFDKKYVSKQVPAESTTIEEYELLRYIGKKLGYIDQMPYVQYPLELSKEDVLYAFGSDNPFSLSEMFCDESDTTIIGHKYRSLD
ncbi:MAG: hypothetical protein IIU76_04030 [Bacteroidales bacterium]|nr:hypothetical protein [Bacteroidales bacterium]